MPGIRKPPGQNISQSQIVAVVVGRRIDSLGLLEKGRGIGHFSRPDIKLTQVVVGVEVPRFELSRLPEFHSRQFHLSQAHEIGGQIGSGGRRIRLQAYRTLKVRAGFRVLRLRGIDQSQEFVDFEALRHFAQQGLQPLRRPRRSGPIHIALRPPEIRGPGLARLAVGCRQWQDTPAKEQQKKMNHSDRCRMITVFVCYHRAAAGGSVDVS